MCGISVAVGTQASRAVLLASLKRQDERGYDSAGVAFQTPSGIKVKKCLGSVEKLEAILEADPVDGYVGIAHTRWATHGGKTKKNAHPHMSDNGKIAVVHNGGVENFMELRKSMIQKGFRYRSETDTENVPHLIEEVLRGNSLGLEDAVAQVVPKLRGNNGFVVLSKDHPDQVVAAALGSPLVVGINHDQLFMASSEKGLPDGCNVLHMRDGEIITLRVGGHIHMRGTQPADWKPRLQKMTTSSQEQCMGNYPHFMLKEIMEQPAVLSRTLAGRLDPKTGVVKFGAFTRDIERQMSQADGITIVACGTSYHAALVGKQAIETHCRIPVTVELASEFIYRNPILGPQNVLIGLSQSGETMDTLKAVRLGKERGALCIGITNEVGSTLAHLVQPTGVFLKAGTEKAVASTKAFVAQVTILLLMAIRIAQVRKSSDPQYLAHLMRAMAELPTHVEMALKTHDQIKLIAGQYQKAKRVFFIGRQYGAPLAYEGALKLNEIANVNSFGFAAGELKHGPIALVRKGVPVVAIAPRDSLEEKMVSNLQEFMAKKGDVIALTTAGDNRIRQFATHVIELPHVPEELVPIVYAPVLQLLSYEMGLQLGCNIDKPLNLAKTVTVE